MAQYSQGVMIINVAPDQYDLAVEVGKQRWFERFGYPADVVCLPTGVDLACNLPVADTPAPAGSVIVGTAQQSYTQGRLV